MTREPRPAALIAMWPEAFFQQFDEARIGRLESLVELVTPSPVTDLDDPVLADELARVEVLVTSWGAPRLTAERLERMPALRAVFHAAGTVRGIATDAFWQRGITVTSAAEANSIPVAEFTFASIVLADKRAQFLSRDPLAHRDDWRTRLVTEGTRTSAARSASSASAESAAASSPCSSSSRRWMCSWPTRTPTPTPSRQPGLDSSASTNCSGASTS